ncbi:MAG: right-handed parallel beta-helix repeat-containing protein, partial [bacterium]
MLRSMMLAAALAARGGAAMTIHVDAERGDDSRDGTAPERAWKSLAPLATAKAEGGVTLLFAGGKAFHGPVTLKGPLTGWTIGSYGAGRAILDGGKGDALVLEDASGFTVRDLLVRGAGRKSGNERGTGGLLRRCKAATVRGVEAEGFQRAGIQVRESEDVRVEDCLSHDNGCAGIHVGGRKITVRRCRAINNPGDPTIMNNHSGNGILL